MSLLSFVVPCYRQGNFLELVLESIYAAYQGQHNVIVVDDSSEDRLTEIALQRLVSAGSRQQLQIVRLTSNSGGVAYPRNIGVNCVESKYMVFLDADDLIVPRSLDSVVSTLEATESDVAIA